MFTTCLWTACSQNVYEQHVHNMFMNSMLQHVQKHVHEQHVPKHVVHGHCSSWVVTFTLPKMGKANWNRLSWKTFFEQNSNESTTAHKVFDRLINVIPKDQLPKNTREALEHVCYRSKISHFGPAYVTDPLVKQMNYYFGCNILSLEKPLDSVIMSVAVRRRNPYTDALNHQ